ncbi:unnamed protein product [Lampetra planeri]
MPAAVREERLREKKKQQSRNPTPESLHRQYLHLFRSVFCYDVEYPWLRSSANGFTSAAANRIRAQRLQQQ